MSKPLDPRLLKNVLECVTGSEPELAMLGKYRLDRELGRGAMGVVFAGEDTALKRKVAVKILGESVTLGEGARQRFQREAQATAAVGHRNVVTLYDAGEDRGRMYLVMEFVEGAAFDTVLKQQPRDIESLVGTIEQIARGVGAAHARGVVHRDLKPANILITPDGTPKVADFGLAHWVQSDMALTQPGAQLGTPLYMAPEQVRSDVAAISPATDVYALGAILYEAISGTPPYMGKTLPEIYVRIMNGDLRSPRSRNPRVARELESICLKALDRNPARRYPNADAFAEDLRRYLDGEPVSARVSTMPVRLWKRMGRNPVAWALGAVAFVALMALATRPGTAPSPPATENSIQAAYRTLLQTLPAMVDLEDRFHGAEARGDRRLEEISDVVRAVEAKYPSAQSPRAWLALAKVYAGRETEGLKELDAACARSGDDPFPDVLAARAHLSAYARDAALPVEDSPFIALDKTCLTVGKFKETDVLKGRREKAVAAIHRALAKKASENLEDARRLLQYAQGIERIGAGEYSAAAKLLAQLKDHPPLKHETSSLQGLALALLGRYGDGAVAWEIAGARGWKGPLLYAGIVRGVEASEREFSERDSLPAMAQGLADLDRVLQIDPKDGRALRARGLLHLQKGGIEIRLGKDPSQSFGRAVADHDELVRSSADRVNALIFRGYFLFVIGRCEQETGIDPVPLFDRAILDFEEVGRARPGNPVILQNLSLINLQKAQSDALWRRDPVEAFDRAISIYNHFPPGTPGVNWNRGNAHMGKGDWKAAHNMDPVPDYDLAVVEYEQAIKMEPGNPAPLAQCGTLHLKKARWIFGTGDSRPEILKALEYFDAACRFLTLQKEPLPYYLQLRGEAHLHLGFAEMKANADPKASFERAISDLSLGIQHADSNSPSVASFYLLRAATYRRLGGWEEAHGTRPEATYGLAISDLDTAFRLKPASFGMAHVDRGDLLFRLGRKAEALAAYREALKIEPGNAHVKEMVARLGRE